MLGAFGKSTNAANNVANAAKFAFGENQSGGIFTAKAVMFGSTPQPTSTSIADKSSNPSLFSFIWLKLVRRRLLQHLVQWQLLLHHCWGRPDDFLDGITSVAPTPAAYFFVSTPSVPNIVTEYHYRLELPALGATVIRHSSTGFAFGSTQLAGSATTAQSLSSVVDLLFWHLVLPQQTLSILLKEEQLRRVQVLYDVLPNRSVARNRTAQVLLENALNVLLYAHRYDR